MKKQLLFILAILIQVFHLQAQTMSESPLVIILLGPPGAGKGTHALPLSEKLGLVHISTGSLFRENIQNKTELGKKVQSYLQEGKLVPDDLVVDLVFSRIKKEDCQKGCILDGFPRTLYQAKILQQKLENSRVMAVNFTVPSNLLIERITGRIVCQGCSASYHRVYAPPHNKGKCDHCNSSLIQREDDKEATVKHRLEIYQKESQPILDFYDVKESLYDVNAEKSPKEVLEELFQTVDAVTLEQPLVSS